MSKTYRDMSPQERTEERIRKNRDNRRVVEPINRAKAVIARRAQNRAVDRMFVEFSETLAAVNPAIAAEVTRLVFRTIGRR